MQVEHHLGHRRFFFCCTRDSVEIFLYSGQLKRGFGEQKQVCNFLRNVF